MKREKAVTDAAAVPYAAAPSSAPTLRSRWIGAGVTVALGCSSLAGYLSHQPPSYLAIAAPGTMPAPNLASFTGSDHSPQLEPEDGPGPVFQSVAAQSVPVVRTMPVVPPDDPFQAVLPPVSQTAPASVVSLRAVGSLPPVLPFAMEPTPQAASAPVAAGRVSPSPVPVARPRRKAPVSPEELAVDGIVQGDDPLVVVQFGGQSLFLKIGDRVADTWQVIEIKERSAVFKLGEQRVEIPIKGGSSS